jgi:ATP-dependent DNA helicase RecG
MSFLLQTPLAELSHLSTRDRNVLVAAGFLTVQDLLTLYPARYEDRRRFDRIPQDATDDPLCIHGVVVDLKRKQVGPRQSYTEVTLEDAEPSAWSRKLSLRFFSMPHISKAFPVDEVVVVYGKIKTQAGRLLMDHPEFEVLGDDPAERLIHMDRIVPIYHKREGVPQRTIRRVLYELLAHLPTADIVDLLRKPSDKGAFAGYSRRLALQQIHFPQEKAQMDVARRYLALEEFFTLQLNVLRRRQEWNELGGEAHCGPGKWLQRWLDSMPFALTNAQQRVIAEIRADLAATRPMNRLLQGDVGSGKTFVAMAAMLLAIESGVQAALMAPTVILAEQHYANFCKWLEPLGLRIGLRTGTRKEGLVKDLFSDGPPQIIIGTHALIAEQAKFENLGLVVIDEQHKFGVQQRAKLIHQGRAPDVLAMTATPIPRTLTMTVYGDLDVSIIDEMPAGRGTIQTTVREQPDLGQVAAFLRQQVELGRQAYLVYPLVEASEKLRLKAATEESAAWAQRLAPIAVGLVHGRMSAEEKTRVMTAYRSGEIKVLISTTVIEVGVDVPNATVMLVFEAERFGLAQLHQLRGRIGRGQHRSWCVLVASGKNPEGTERLKVLEKTADGFAVAEEDLKLRGPGDLLGTAQSGLPGLQLGDLVRDQELVQVARQLAAEALRQDSKLAKYQSLLFSNEQTATLS